MKPFTLSYRYFSGYKHIGLHNKGMSKRVFTSHVFVFTPSRFEKWREVIHFSIANKFGTSVNASIPEELKSIKYSRLRDFITTAIGAKVATIRGHKTVFKQVKISNDSIIYN